MPSEAGVWYYFRKLDYPRTKELYELGNRMAQAAAMMTDTTGIQRLVGLAWPPHFNKIVAEYYGNLNIFLYDILNFDGI